MLAIRGGGGNNCIDCKSAFTGDPCPSVDGSPNQEPLYLEERVVSVKGTPTQSTPKVMRVSRLSMVRITRSRFRFIRRDLSQWLAFFKKNFLLLARNWVMFQGITFNYSILLISYDAAQPLSTSKLNRFLFFLNQMKKDVRNVYYSTLVLFHRM